MTVEQLINSKEFQLDAKGNDTSRTIESIFCCDLLSIAMSKAPAGSAWITVMANVNTLAVASLAEIAVIVLAEGVSLDEDTKERALTQGITVLSTKEPVYYAAKKIDQMIHETDLV